MFNVIKKETDLVKSNISKMYENSSERIEKAHTRHKYLRIENGKYIYDDSQMNFKNHKKAAEFHKQKGMEIHEEVLNDRPTVENAMKGKAQIRDNHLALALHHQKLAEEKKGDDLSLLNHKDLEGYLYKNYESENKEETFNNENNKLGLDVSKLKLVAEIGSFMNTRRYWQDKTTSDVYYDALPRISESELGPSITKLIKNKKN